MKLMIMIMKTIVMIVMMMLIMVMITTNFIYNIKTKEFVAFHRSSIFVQLFVNVLLPVCYDTDVCIVLSHTIISMAFFKLCKLDPVLSVRMYKHKSLIDASCSFYFLIA